MTWTPERHQAAKERCENATPITWYCEEPGHDSPFTEEYDYALRAKPDPLTTIGSHEIGSLYRPDDADFVSHARTDLPDALAEIERLQALLAQAQQFVPTLRELAEETHDVSTYPDPQERTHNIMMIHFAQMWLDEMRCEQEAHS